MTRSSRGPSRPFRNLRALSSEGIPCRRAKSLQDLPVRSEERGPELAQCRPNEIVVVLVGVVDQPVIHQASALKHQSSGAELLHGVLVMGGKHDDRGTVD